MKKFTLAAFLCEGEKNPKYSEKLKTKTWKNLIAYFVVFLFFGGLDLNAQTAPLPPAKDCTSKDLEVDDAFLEFGTCFQCVNGTQSFPLTLSINNKTGSFRQTFAFWGTLEVYRDGVLVSSTPISGCNDTKGLEPMTLTEVTFQNIPYTCGTTLNLTNLTLAWTDASKVTSQESKNSCTNLTTTTVRSTGFLDIAPKCGTLPDLEIRTPLVAFAGTDDAVCFNGGVNSIQLDGSASGGNGSYSYSWSGTGSNYLSATNIANPFFNNAPVGTYTLTLTVTDANECTDTDTVNLTITDNPTASAVANNPSCFGVDNAGFTITASGGTGTLLYSKDNGATYVSSGVFTGLAAGTYNWKVKDEKDCTTSGSVQIAIPTDITASAVANNPSCSGVDNGEFTITASGGTGTLQYSKDNGATYVSSGVFTGLAAGTYNWKVKDANNCTKSGSVEIAIPTDITASAAANNPSCFGVANSGFTITASGGTGTLQYSKDNGATYVSSGVFTGLAAGTYNWKVKDANNCTKSGSVEIAIPTDITASAAANNPSCFGVANSGFTITASGGTGTLEYSKDNGATYVSSGVFTGLAAGTYNWKVKDANNCTKSGSVEIAIPTDITASAVANNPSCFGVANSGFTITASGGTGTLEYSKDNGATYVSSGVFTGLAAGTYNWKVKDANNCTKSGSVEIAIPTDITASAAANNPSCFGVANSGFTITASGGTGTLEYSKDNGATYVSSGVFTGLAAGTYNWKVKDANNCTKSGSVEIAIPTDITASAVANNPSCFGVANSGFTITASGGTGTLQYSKDNGATYVSSGVFTGLAAGTYNWKVKDANNCTKSGSVEIAIPTDITASAVANNPSCFGVANSGFTITASGGTGTLQYSKDNGATYVSSGVFTGLAAGTYNWKVKDANNCTKSGSVEIAIPTDITASAVANNPSCFGVANSGFTITASGGTGTLEYSKDNGATYVSSGVFTGLAAGTYNWKVKDANNCTKSGSVEIAIPTDITASAAANNPSCFGVANSGFTITASGGTGTLQYSKDNGATYVSSGVFTGLAAGTYNWKVKDANNCTKSGSVEIAIPTDITASAVANNPSCFGVANSGFTITASGGTGTLQYSKDNGATYVSSGVFTGLAAGTYNWKVKDANNCTKSGSVEIAIPTDITASAVANNPSCFGVANSGFTITASGGTGTLEYSKDNGATYVSSGVFTGLAAGTYNWKVKDANNCIKSGSVEIAIPTALSGSAVPTAESCAYSDGSIVLTVNGGTAPYTFLWNNGATSQNLSGLSAGLYSVTITDANGCPATASATVNAPGNCIVDQGCTPGYWKNHLDAWAVAGVVPTADFFVFFGITNKRGLDKYDPNGGSFTLFDAISSEVKTSDNNGWFAELARHAVAAYLNSSHPEVGYAMSPSAIRTLTATTFNGNYGNGKTGTTNANNEAKRVATILKGYNELYCPLGNEIKSALTTSVIQPSESTIIVQEEESLLNSTVVNSFNVSPVPFRESLSVQYDFDYVSSATVQMFDMQGRLLLTQKEANASKGKITNLNINFRILPSQVYVIKVTTDRDVFTKKIVSSK